MKNRTKRAILIVSFALVAACEPVADGAMEGVEPQSRDVVSVEPAALQGSARDGGARPGVDLPAGLDEAQALAASLRPIDSPLPGRDRLERGYADPVGLLVEIVRGGWAGPLERGNALRVLGDWGTSARVGELLVSVALDPAERAPFRIAALTGLQRAPEATQLAGPALRVMLRDGDAGVASAAALLLARDPASRGEVERVAADPEAHRDVRRIAKLALRGPEGGK